MPTFPDSLENVDPQAKRSYAKYVGDVWINTKRTSNVAFDERTWKVMELMVNDIANYAALKENTHKYIPYVNSSSWTQLNLQTGKKKNDRLDTSIEELMNSYIFFFTVLFKTKAAVSLTEQRMALLQSIITTLIDMSKKHWENDFLRLQLVKRCLKSLTEFTPRVKPEISRFDSDLSTLTNRASIKTTDSLKNRSDFKAQEKFKKQFDHFLDLL